MKKDGQHRDHKAPSSYASTSWIFHRISGAWTRPEDGYPFMQVLNEDILPALEKLRAERSQYMQWQAASAQQDRLKRFCVAYQYQQAEQ